MRKFFLFLILLAPLAFAQHNTQSIYYVDDQDSATGNAKNIWFNIKAKPFNAVGDGAHDTQDAAAFLAAITAAGMAGGGVVYVPPGDFYAGNPGFSYDNITIRGAGPMEYNLSTGFSSGGTRIRGNWNIFGKNFRAYDATFYNDGEILIFYSTASNLVLENCLLVNKYSYGPYHNLLLNSSDNAFIVGCRSYKAWHGFAIRASNAHVIGCQAYANYAAGLTIKAGDGEHNSNIIVSNFSAYSPNADSMSAGIMITTDANPGDLLEGVIINGFSVRGAAEGIETSDVADLGHRSRNIHISGGIVDSSRYWGIHLKQLDNVTVSGVTVKHVLPTYSFPCFFVDTSNYVSLVACRADSSVNSTGFIRSGGTQVSAIDYNSVGCAVPMDFGNMFDYAQTGTSITSNVTVTGNLNVAGYEALTGMFYHYSDLAVLNKAGNAFLTWAHRDISGSDATVWLQNFTIPGNLPVGGYVAVTGMINHSSNLAVLNKAANGYNTWATRNISGSDAVIDLSTIGTINASGVNASSVTVGSIAGTVRAAGGALSATPSDSIGSAAKWALCANSTSATSGTMTVNMTSSVVTITPAGACTFNTSTGITGQRVTFCITTSGATPYTLTWNTGFKSTGTLSTGSVSGKKFTVSFVLVDGANWCEVSRTGAM